MTEPSPRPSDRLDSWKAIAEHLGREVRTVRRWEQKLRLPVRRVPGGRGHSVFAYVSEIDAWLKATPPAQQAGAGESDAPGAAPARRSRRWVPAWGFVATGLVLAVAGIAWHAYRPPFAAAALTFRVTPEAVVATGPSGEERWRYTFPAGEAVTPLVSGNRGPAVVLENEAGVLVTVGRLRKSDDAHLPGLLLWFSTAGVLKNTFSFADRVTFGAEQYQDWALTDYRVFEQNGHRRIAVSGHHLRWWPSFVQVFDDDGRPHGKFVNAGWVEHLHWLRADRLLVAGFANERDGGMVALLDTNALDGASPVWQDAKFQCTSCGRAVPLRYIVFPRSEINRVTGSRFNRAQVEVAGDRIIVRTLEVPIEDTTMGVDALYELTPSLDIVRASYADRYWDIHRALELEGRIHHSRDTCPDRYGPRTAEVWDAAGGWRTVRIPGPPVAAAASSRRPEP